MRRWIWIGVVVLLLGGGVLEYLRVRRMAGVGAGYVAKEVCSCVFVGGRSFASCRGDVPASMDRVRAEQLPSGVHAYVRGFAERTATFDPVFGCTLR